MGTSYGNFDRRSARGARIGISEMNHVFHRNSRSEYPVAAGGEGPYLMDSAGKRYLDASGGAAVSCVGHGHPAVIAAKIGRAHV